MPTINININDILSQVESQVESLALTTASAYKDQAIAAGKQILNDMKTDLARWSQLLADKKLSTDEFEVLVKSYEVELAVSGLEQAGLAEVRAYDFGISVLNTIIDVVLKVVSSLAGSLL